MRISKRLLAGLMAVILCASMLVISTVAANSDITVQAKVSSATVKQGDKVTVEILLSSEKKVDFAAGDFQVNFDADALAVEKTDKMVTSYTAGEIVKEKNNLSVSNPKDGVLKVLYCDETDTQTGAIKADGVLAKIEFTVSKTAPVGATEITFTENGDFVIPDESDPSGFKSYTVEYKGVSLTVEQLEQTTTQAPTTVAPTDKPTTVTPDTDKDDSQVAAKKPAKVKGVKVKVAKKKVTVTWKKAKNAKKYRVKYSYKKNMKKAKYKTVKKTKVVIKKLKSGKKVYIQVQGVNGKLKGKFSKKVAKKVK